MTSTLATVPIADTIGFQLRGLPATRSDVADTGSCLASTFASLWAIYPVQLGNRTVRLRNGMASSYVLG